MSTGLSELPGAAASSETAPVVPRRRSRGRSGFWRYIAGSLLQALPLIFLILALNFALIQASPGDPVDVMAPPGAPAEYKARIREAFGLDEPVMQQFLTYAGNVAQGDLGTSIRYQEDVLGLIISRLGATLLLTGVGFLLSVVVGVLLGVWAGRRANSPGDHAVTFLALAGSSMPVFWLGQLLLIVFALNLGLFPTDGMESIRAPKDGFAHVLDVAHHLVLPLLAYSVYPTTLIYRLTRLKMQETLSLEFITTARAKGLASARVTYRHALPNAFAPVLTVIGYSFGFMLAGSVLVENVFGWDGMGALLADAIAGRDFPVILGIFVVTSVMVILANLLTDILYALLDPRVATAGRAS